MVVLETSRLSLRVPGEEDADFMLELFSDPNVNRFLLSSTPYSREIILEGIARSQACHAANKFSRWILQLKSTQELVGHAGLLVKEIESVPEIELGYALRPSAWGQGYAFEATVASLDYAFGKLGRDRVVAIIHPENRASIRVAERIGMVNERKILWERKAAYLFSAKA
jgi:ribosomal-protein-alanine N-acetyltransferase